MHELSICQSLVRQLEELAQQHNYHSISLVKIQIGPLSGVEPSLLCQAFPLASTGTRAEGARLETQITPIRIKCAACGQEGNAKLNNLTCTYCGHWQTRLLSGNELILTSIEMDATELNHV